MPFEAARITSSVTFLLGEEGRVRRMGELAMFYASILRSEPYPGRVYHGHTSDLRRRLTDHNSGDNVSTRHGRPWVIIASGSEF